MTFTGVVLRWRYALLAVWTAVWCQHAYSLFAGKLGDFFVLAYGGRALWGIMPSYHGGALHLYAQDPILQVGPPPLLILGGLERFTPYHAQLIYGVLIALLALPTLRAIELTAVRVGCDRHRAAVFTLLGGAVFLAGWAQIEQFYHLEDALAIASIFGAVALIAARRPWWIPALLLGFAVACKPWAIVAAPLLLALPEGRRIRGAGVALASAAVWWLPFIVADPHTVSELGSLPSRVEVVSALRGLGWHREMAPPAIRILEFTLGAAFASLAVLRRRWLAVPLAAFAGRILLDPKWFVYYGVGPLAAALLWDMAGTRRWFPVWTAATGVVEFLLPLYAPDQLAAVGQVLFVVAVLVFVVWPRPSTEDEPVDDVSAEDGLSSSRKILAPGSAA